jgi:hypothetical protein
VLGTTVKADDPNNIGYGFWTHQLQSAFAWYPFDNKGTAVTSVVTYEHHSNKNHYDLQPGDDITLNWGISQYLPLTKSQQLLLEIGPTGWNGWQVSVDTGADASNRNRDRTFAARADRSHLRAVGLRHELQGVLRVLHPRPVPGHGVHAELREEVLTATSIEIAGLPGKKFAQIAALRPIFAEDPREDALPTCKPGRPDRDRKP